MYCKHCGNELVTEDADVCTKCGKLVSAKLADSVYKPTGNPTKAWYLFPILMGFIGGIIAYLVLRDENKMMAKNCLIFGIIWSAIGLVIATISVAFLGHGR